MLRCVSIVTLLILLQLVASYKQVDTENIRAENRNGQIPGNGRQITPNTYLQLNERPPLEFRVTNGSTILFCEAEGRPIPDIYWLKDGQRIKQTYQRTERGRSEGKFNVGSSNGRLFLDCLSTTAAGQYACVVENTYHTISASTQISISNDPKKRKCADPKLREPRIYLWSNRVTERKGQQILLRCRFDTRFWPAPGIDWRSMKLGLLGKRESSGKIVMTHPDDNKYQVLENGDLTISDFQRRDEGKYFCDVYNLNGEDTKTIEVYYV